MNPLMTHRLSLLLDPESFVSRCTPDDGELVGGTGTIGGRRVCIIAINPEACGPVDPFEVLQQELALLDLAEEESLPLIHLADRPGRVAMGTTAIPLAIMRTFIDSRGAGRIFARFAHLSGVVPRIAVVFNSIATTLTYPVVECDTVVMTDLAGMSLARPDMVRLMTGDPSPYEDYGGPGCIPRSREPPKSLSFLKRMRWTGCGNIWHSSPRIFHKRLPGLPRISRARIIPGSRMSSRWIPIFRSTCTMSSTLSSIKDPFSNTGLSTHARSSPPLPGLRETCWALLPTTRHRRGGILFPESCRKIAAFASLCDAFNIPLVFLADIPGFMVGRSAEQAGIIHHGALVFSTIANLSVPHLCIVVRKAYTAGLYAMGGPGFDPERFVAFPHATITIYGAKAIHLLARENHLSDNERLSMADQMKANCDALKYAESGLLDAVISEHQLRAEVERFLKSFHEKSLDRTGPRRVLYI